MKTKLDICLIPGLHLGRGGTAYPVCQRKVDSLGKVETLVESRVISPGEGDHKFTSTLVRAYHLEGGREGGREEGREEGRKRGREGEREEGREGGREGGRRISHITLDTSILNTYIRTAMYYGEVRLSEVGIQHISFLKTYRSSFLSNLGVRLTLGRV